MYNSALFSHGVFYVNRWRVVPISLQSVFSSLEVFYLAASDMMDSGALTSLENCLTACMNSYFDFIGTK